MPVEEHRLQRTVTLWPIVLFGIAYITPFIALTTFGVFSEASNGTLPTAYAFGATAMIFTALSYGKMAREFFWTTSGCPWSSGSSAPPT